MVSKECLTSHRSQARDCDIELLSELEARRGQLHYKQLPEGLSLDAL